MGSVIHGIKAKCCECPTLLFSATTLVSGLLEKIAMQLESILSCTAQKSTVLAACDFRKENVNEKQLNRKIQHCWQATFPSLTLFSNCLRETALQLISFQVKLVCCVCMLHCPALPVRQSEPSVHLLVLIYD